MTAALQIDVHIELICPWCQIGLRQLQRARASLRAAQPTLALELVWHLEPLLPNLPESGLPFRDFYINRLGSWPAVQARQAQVKAAGRSVGLDFDFDAIECMPNTALAHALLRDAKAQLAPEALEALLERLFAAHFQLGQNLGEPELLDTLAEAFGVHTSATPRPLPAPSREVPGVPYFVFNRQYALSGAQPAERLLSVMQQALQLQPA